MQSFGFYSQLAWIPPSYEDRGWSARDAGLLLAVWSIVQLASGLGVPVLADRLADRRPLVAGSVCCGLLGLLGVLLAPDAAPVVWVVLMGLGQGGGFAVALVKLVDYAPSPAASARLSALVFLVAYSTASTGPLVFGAVHDATGGFTVPYALLAVVLLAQLTLVPRLRPGRLTEPADEQADKSGGMQADTDREMAEFGGWRFTTVAMGRQRDQRWRWGRPDLWRPRQGPLRRRQGP